MAKVYALTPYPFFTSDEIFTEDVAIEVNEMDGVEFYELDAHSVKSQAFHRLRQLDAEHGAMRRDEIYYENGKRSSYTIRIEAQIEMLKHNIRIAEQAIREAE